MKQRMYQSVCQSIRQSIYLIACSSFLVGCHPTAPPASVPVPSPAAPTAEPSPTAATPSPTPATAGTTPEIGTFTLNELDLRGCGMTLYAPGSDPMQPQIYLFSGLVDPAIAPKTGGSMRMKLDGALVKFTRTATSGEAVPGGQFTTQTFVSEDGSITVTVEIGTVTPGSDPEIHQITDAVLTVTRNGQTSRVEAIGDAGC